MLPPGVLYTVVYGIRFAVSIDSTYHIVDSAYSATPQPPSVLDCQRENYLLGNLPEHISFLSLIALDVLFSSFFSRFFTKVRPSWAQLRSSVWCREVLCPAVRCSALRSSAVPRSAVWCCAVRCRVVACCVCISYELPGILRSIITPVPG